MASLRKKPRSPFWFACFSLPDGRRTQRSTKLSEKPKAMKLAMEWEEAAAKRITTAQARRVLSDIHEQIHGERLDSPTFKSYAAQWLTRKKGETAAVSYAAYKNAINDFERALGDKASEPIHYVTPTAIAKWQDASSAKATARTANNKLKILRVLFQSAWREGLLPDGNPAAKISVLKTAESNRRPFTLPELKAVLRVASTEWRGMLLAGIYTGQRLKDIASLTWANVDIERGEIRLFTSKTSRRQILPIAKPLLAYLMELDASDDPAAPIFPSAYKIAVQNLHIGTLSNQFNELLATAGLVKAPPATHAGIGKGRNAPRERNAISFHALRHTATSLLKNAGVSEAVAMDIIGHDSKEISQHYTHVDEATKRAAIDKLPDVTEGLK